MNIPSFLLNRNVRGVAQAATAGLLASVPAHISITGNKFTLVDAAGNEKPTGYLHEGNLSLDIVIVYANPNVSKIFYDRPYDPNDSGPPDCFSDNGQAPSINAGTPQSNLCSVCPKNSWGSATSNMTGKQTKACQDSKKLGVLVPAIAGEMVFMLKVPPNSLKGLNAYVRKIAEWDLGPRKADPSDITTRISFESQGTLRFDEVDFISEQAAGWVAALDSPEAEAKLDLIVGKTDRPRQEALPAPQQGLQPNPQLAPTAGASQEHTNTQSFQAPSDTSSQGSFPNGTATAASPSDAPARRRGRPEGATNKPKAAAAQTAPSNGPGFLTDKQDLEDNDVPAFLRKNTPPVNNADPNPDMPFNTGTKSTFGIVPNPAVPDASLKSALDAAFALPTR